MTSRRRSSRSRLKNLNFRSNLPTIVKRAFIPLLVIAAIFVSGSIWALLLQTDSLAAADSTKKKTRKPKLDVIILDAGHGGKDPGAIGTHGFKEKTATLAIALK